MKGVVRNVLLFFVIVSIACALVTITLKQLGIFWKASVVFKVLTTLMLFLAVFSDAVFSYSNGKAGVLVSFGLLAGVLGDFFLEFERFFIYGMVAFLLGHMFYVFGFYMMGGLPSLSLLILVLATGVVYFLFIKKFLGKDKFAVFLYVLAICTMVAFSSSVNVLTFSGAVLFFLSDAILAFDKYVRKVPSRDLLVLSTYFAGQLLIALSVL